MDPTLAQALAGLISAVATVLLMAGTFYFGKQGRASRREEEDQEEEVQ